MSQPGLPWLRLAAIPLVVALLLWIRIEDQTITWPVILAGLVNAWFALRWAASQPAAGMRPAYTQTLALHLLLGSLAGLLVTPLAIFLMVFKTGWHSHPLPDFTFDHFRLLVGRTPVWVLAGSLLGFGVGLLRLGLAES